MKIDILTIFPEMFTPLKTSILGKAQENNVLNINIVDIREFSDNKHKKVDDYPYGGGTGMLMSVQPIDDAILSVKTQNSYVVYMSAKGKKFNQVKAVNMAKKHKHLIILCGHYEGVDQRVIDMHVDEEISIGDYILTGGELAAMVLTDAISRNIKGVLGNQDALKEESFSNNLLEYPQYTRPKVYKNLKVPEVLLNGNHKEIKKWKEKKSKEITKRKRPDLIKKDTSNEN
ncbi:MAG: tRNA (guanosine(37)-N1)-methyltransferase TrmD [Candidatus Woesearchaeota archaeon]